MQDFSLFAMAFSVDRLNQSKMPTVRTNGERNGDPRLGEESKGGRMAEVILRTSVIFYLAAFDFEQKVEENALWLYCGKN